MNLRQLTNDERATILASLDVMKEIIEKNIEKNPGKPIPELKLIKAVIAVVEPGALMVLEMTPEENKQFANSEIKVEKMEQFVKSAGLSNSRN